jgi:hypothetical protein
MLIKSPLRQELFISENDVFLVFTSYNFEARIICPVKMCYCLTRVVMLSNRDCFRDLFLNYSA